MKVTLGFSSLGLLEKVIFLSFFLFFSYLVRAFEWIDCVLASELRQYETWTLFSFLKIIRQLVKGAWVSAYQSKWRKMNKNSTRASQDYLSLHSLSHHSHWGEKITNPSSCLHFLIFLFFSFLFTRTKGRNGLLGDSDGVTWIIYWIFSIWKTLAWILDQDWREKLWISSLYILKAI